jgi:hypothetical protein
VGKAGRPRSEQATKVVSWLNEAPDRTIRQAAALFGVSESKIRVWKSRRKIRDPMLPREPRASKVVPLVSVPQPSPIPTPPVLVMPPMPPSQDAAIRNGFRGAVLRRLRWLTTEESLTDPNQRAVAAVIATLVEHKHAILELGAPEKVVDDGPDPSTPEGEAALELRLAALPPHLLHAAMERQRAGGS